MKTKKITKIGICDPYLNTLGGGERYTLSIAEFFNNQGISVDIFWDGNQEIIEQASKRFQINLNRTKVVKNIFSNKNLLFRYLHTFEYDLIFYVSDGSVPFLFAKQNLLHFQVPFNHQTSFSASLLNKLKLLLITKVITNSNFTDKVTRKLLHTTDTQVLYPPVDITKFHPGSKQNQIISVGRFDNILNAKRQDILIQAFIKICQSNKNLGWELVLAGGSTNPESQHIQDLKKLAQGYPIEFYFNTPFEKLQSLYSSSKIYWHSAGYNVDENISPQSTEHFGMVIVEAMAAGIVPIGISKGGIPEIIQHQVDGFLWNDIDELVSYTMELINQPDKLQKISEYSIAKSKQFSKEHFFTNFLKILNA